MFSIAVRLPIRLASLIVPGARREEWIREWYQELERRAEDGASESALRARAWEAVRDAAWVRRTTGYNPVADFLSRPFRADVAFLVCAAAAWLATGAYRPPPPPFPNAERVVILERGISSIGTRRSQMSRQLVDRAREISSFNEVALFTLWYRIPGVAFVSENFFDVLGIKLADGRGFRTDDKLTSAVVSSQYVREHPDAGVGGSIQLGDTDEDYEVLGIIPDDFRFEGRQIHLFVPLPSYVKTVGAVALLKPGASPEAAQREFRRLAITIEPDWKAENFHLRRPVAQGGWEVLLALSLGGVAFLASASYLLWKRIRGARYYLTLAVRLLMALAALCALQAALQHVLLRRIWLPSILTSWLFLAVCAFAVILVVRDHLYRCPVCLENLRMPVSLGIWSSVVMDPPGTEYVCPRGHGLLYTPESGETDTHWTKLDPSWNDLFQRHD